MNPKLAAFFKSPACAAVIYCLALSPCGAGLRQISYRSKLGLRSVQIALNYLLAQGIINLQLREDREVYLLNQTYSGISEIYKITEILFKSALTDRSKNMSASLSDIIAFCDQTNNLKSTLVFNKI